LTETRHCRAGHENTVVPDEANSAVRSLQSSFTDRQPAAGWNQPVRGEDDVSYDDAEETRHDGTSQQNDGDGRSITGRGRGGLTEAGQQVSPGSYQTVCTGRTIRRHTCVNMPPICANIILLSAILTFKRLGVRVPICQKLGPTNDGSGTGCFIAVPIRQQWASKG